MRSLPALVIAGLALLLSACFHEKSPPAEETPPASISVTAETEQLTLWELDSGATLNVSVNDAEGQPLDPQPALSWQNSDETVVSIDENGFVTALAEGQAVITVSAKGEAVQIVVTVDTALTNISGTLRYQDKIYSTGGFEASVDYNPIRYAEVDILDAQGSVLTTTQTDGTGAYQFVGSSAGEYSLRVVSKTAMGSGYQVEVADLSGDLYAVTQSLDLSDISQADVSIPVSSGLAGVFNMLDVMTTGLEFFSELTNASLPLLSAFWQPGNALGTYYCTGYAPSYCSQGMGVYVYNEGSFGDTDEFDDDVLWHEFGHFIVDQLSWDDSPGGCHFLTSTDLDLRLAWSEGWGDFLPAAIKSWLNEDATRVERLSQPAEDPMTLYVDTAGSYAQIAVNIASNSPAYWYASNEVAVAKILWRLSREFGMSAVWSVMQGYLPTVTTPVNMESFWDGWLVTWQSSTADLELARGILRDQMIYYQSDSYENDDNLPVSRKYNFEGIGETHYLYGENDVDMIAFDVIAGRTYRAETFNLRNGADTYLKVLDVNGLTVAYNDDADPSLYYRYDADCGETRVHNDGSALASQAEFIAQATGTYYAEISSTPDPDPYPEAGRYGTYSFRVSPQ